MAYVRLIFQNFLEETEQYLTVSSGRHSNLGPFEYEAEGLLSQIRVQEASLKRRLTFIRLHCATRRKAAILILYLDKKVINSNNRCIFLLRLYGSRIH
jgi:hypothetical protein